jgi:hypothetical protein
MTIEQRGDTASVKPGVDLARRATLAGLVATGAGLVVLFGYSLSEVIANPGLSLVDGYWIGRLPLTAIGVNLAVFGATVAVGFGTVAALSKRRWVVLLPLAVAGLWWGFAMIPRPVARGSDPCPPYEIDPIAIAYSSPEQTVLWLLLPAAIIAAIALRGSRRPGS